MGRIVSFGNCYNKTILVKYDVQEKFVTLKEFAIKGGVNVAGFGAEGGGRQVMQYDWNIINIQFTPIRPGKFLHRKAASKDVYLSVITEDGDIIANTWLVDRKSSFVVTEDMELKPADDKDPLKVHKDYVKICQEPSVTKSSEDKERVTEDMNLMEADDKNTFKVFKDYVKIEQEPRATKSSEDKEGDSSTKQQPVTRRLDITQIKAEKSTSLDVKVDSDDHDCDIWGLAVTSNGTLLLADYDNKTIKSVSPDNGVLSVLKMSSSPVTVTALDSTTAVTNSYNEILYIIDISDPTALTIKKEIRLRFDVLALAKYRSGLIVTCDSEPVSTKLIDFSGKELWSITKDESGEDLFDWPCGIVLSEIDNEDTAVVIDYDESTITITLLGAENGRLMRVINADEKQPYGVTIDNELNVYVVYSNSDEISVWSRDFTSNRILLSENDLAEMPRAIVYSEVTDSLYISYKENTRIDCFRLK